MPVHDDLDVTVTMASLHHAEEPYVPLYRQRNSRANTDGHLPDIDARRSVKSALNKLTAEIYDKLSLVIVDHGLRNPSVARYLVDTVFEKAIAEPGFIAMYAELCTMLVARSPVFEDGLDFRRLLIMVPQARIESLVQISVGSIEDDEERVISRLNLSGTMEWIDELYKCDVLTENIIHSVIGRLISHHEDEYLLESLCRLLSTIGQKPDGHASRANQQTAVAVDATSQH